MGENKNRNKKNKMKKKKKKKHPCFRSPIKIKSRKTEKLNLLQFKSFL